MKRLKKAAFSYVAPLLSVFGMATAPIIESEAQQCCDPAPCCLDWSSLLVPALVGAAAGAGTAAAINNKGKRGHRGPQGDKGDPGSRGAAGRNPFIQSDDGALTVSFQITSITGVGANLFAPIVPYIGTPEGSTQTLLPFTFADSGASAVEQTTIGSPFFGNYIVGFEVPAHSVPVTIGYVITVTPYGRTPTTYVASVDIPVSTTETQIGLDYTYGPQGTLPPVAP